jgi:peptide/nickel transport system substrate-binding protein
MLWLMPMEPTRWAPLQGQWYAVRGTAQARQELDEDPYERTPPRMEPEPGGPIDRLWKLYDRARVETDAVRRNRLVWEMVRIHIDEGPFFMGAVANFPQIEVVKRGLRNVPQREELARQGFVNDWEYPTPAAYDPEAWYWDDPASRS